MSSFVEPRLVEAPLDEVRLVEAPLDEVRLAEELLEERLLEERLAEVRLAEVRLLEERLVEELLEERLAEKWFDEERFIEGSPDKAAQVLVDLTRKPIGRKVIAMLQKCGGFRNESLIDSMNDVGIDDDDDYMDDDEDFYYPCKEVVGWDRYDDFNVDDDWS